MAANNVPIKHAINFILNVILICYCHSQRSALSHFQSNYLQLQYYAHVLPFWYQDINMCIMEKQGWEKICELGVGMNIEYESHTSG